MILLLWSTDLNHFWLQLWKKRKKVSLVLWLHATLIVLSFNVFCAVLFCEANLLMICKRVLLSSTELTFPATLKDGDGSRGQISYLFYNLFRSPGHEVNASLFLLFFDVQKRVISAFRFSVFTKLCSVDMVAHPISLYCNIVDLITFLINKEIKLR